MCCQIKQRENLRQIKQPIYFMKELVDQQETQKSYHGGYLNWRKEWSPGIRVLIFSVREMSQTKERDQVAWSVCSKNYIILFVETAIYWYNDMWSYQSHSPPLSPHVSPKHYLPLHFVLLLFFLFLQQKINFKINQNFKHDVFIFYVSTHIKRWS